MKILTKSICRLYSDKADTLMDQSAAKSFCFELCQYYLDAMSAGRLADEGINLDAKKSPVLSKLVLSMYM